MSKVMNTVGSTKLALNTANDLGRSFSKFEELSEYSKLNPSFQNDFMNALPNQIARFISQTNFFYHEVLDYVTGYEEFGDTIAETYVNLLPAREYKATAGADEVFSSADPEIFAVGHKMNYNNKFKVTINRSLMQQAFRSKEGMNNMINTILGQLYNSDNVTIFETIKDLFAVAYENATVLEVGTDSKNWLKNIKRLNNDFKYLKRYNEAGVLQVSSDTRYMLTNEADAEMDVETLASVFQLDKASVSARKTTLDNFKSKGEDGVFVDENILGVVFDTSFLNMFINLRPTVKVFENPATMAFTFWLHDWRTIFYSVFSNAVFLVKEMPEKKKARLVTQRVPILLTDKTDTAEFEATVVYPPFSTASDTVNWTYTVETDANWLTTSVDENGVVTVKLKKGYTLGNMANVVVTAKTEVSGYSELRSETQVQYVFSV